MKRISTGLIALTGLALSGLAPNAGAEVVGVDVSQRADIGSSGYEKIVGTLHFAINPKDAHNSVIVDLDKAPVTKGRVEFTSDFYILRPKDSARSNGVALFEVSNRGGKTLLSQFNRAGRKLDPVNEADLGDGFLTNQGYTLVWVGWQFDVEREGGRLKVDAPIAKGVSTLVRSQFTIDRRSNEFTLSDLDGYSLDAGTPEAELTVRDGLNGQRQPIARDAWQVSGHKLTLNSGFELGRTYELVVRANDVPVTGVGLAAFRDTSSWLKYSSNSLAPVKYAYAQGESQSGRFLRTLMYYGFNSDEKNRQVFDGIMAHIAGSARLSLNERGATPNASKAPSPAFPFANSATRDPVGGRSEGLLDNPRARKNQPKFFYTNTPVEYWSGDRSAALIHLTPDGKKDLAPPDNVRIYFMPGAQHIPAAFPPKATTGQQIVNPTEHSWTLRALLTAMDKWVRQGTPPPASQYPKLSDGTLVDATKINFPAIPGVQMPNIIAPGLDRDKPMPHFVSAVDADGNEVAGVRSAEQGVPVGTFTGWNFRSAALGATNLAVQLMGSEIPFAASAATKKAGDPRASLAERYGTKEQFLAQAKAHCDKLVAGGYLLASDIPQVMKRMNDQWDWASTLP